jgi:hypothetical protein
MIVTILAEPRSGSTNLTNWFYNNKNFTTLFEPINPTSKWFQKNKHPSKYNYRTEHLCVKEVHYPNKNWTDLISISNKIILLYRQDENTQIESWINAKNTNNWDGKWSYSKDNFKLNEIEVSFFKELKKSFKELYLNNTDYFKISYEELYQNDGFQKIVEYLNIDCVKNENFPVGEKYRVETNGIKKLF